VLGWTPDAAWRATIPEIRAAAAGRFGPARAAAPDHAMLAALMAAFPDDDSTGAP
jgi:Phage tail assembly chaperone protein, TAC